VDYRRKPCCQIFDDDAAATQGLEMLAKFCGVLVLAGAVGACSATLEDAGGIYVAPGKFDLLKCPDLAKRSMDASAREKKLISLMDRANQDATGPVVNALVYSTDLNTVRAELALLRKTAAEKNCDNLVTRIDQSSSTDQSRPKPRPPKPDAQQSPPSDIPALH
jgi:hypothetical protein